MILIDKDYECRDEEIDNQTNKLRAMGDNMGKLGRREEACGGIVILPIDLLDVSVVQRTICHKCKLVDIMVKRRMIPEHEDFCAGEEIVAQSLGSMLAILDDDDRLVADDSDLNDNIGQVWQRMFNDVLDDTIGVFE